MFGLITQFHVLPDQRAVFMQTLLEASGGLEGCLGYVVAADANADNGVWVTELWRDQASHATSLRLETAREAIAKARPMMTGVGTRVETHPVTPLPPPAGAAP